MTYRNGMLALIGGIVLGLGLAPAPARAQAQQKTVCTSTDLTGMVIGNQDCPNTLLPVTLSSGTLTMCLHAIATPGGQAIGEGHADGDGIGFDTAGNEYLFLENAMAGLQVDVGETIVVTATASAELIGLGSAPNEVVDVVLHVVLDANGNVLNVIIDKMTARCQG